MASANYRGSFGSSPAFPVASISTPEPSSFLGLTPLTSSNVVFSPDRSVHWFDAAAASTTEREPLLVGGSSQSDDEVLQTEVEDEEGETTRVTQPTAQPQYLKLLRAIVFGVILAVVVLPIVTAYASIIFKHVFFDRYFSSLVRHMYLSNAIQQFVMTTKSTLPFAIGQIQDIGLYFMTVMAEFVIDDKLPNNPSEKDNDFVIGGVLFVLTFGTLFVGVLLLVVSALRLASLVQYVPLPVVGGYLGYLGYFLMISGAFLSADIDGEGYKSYPDLIAVDHEWWHSPLFKAFVGIAFCSSIHLFVTSVNHPASLPAILVAIPALFYVILFGSGASIDDARQHGWLSESSEDGSDSQSFLEIWGLVNFSEFPNYFDLIPKQLRTIVPLFFLVAFGSCLDIAAIQQDYTKEIDFNKELATVGLQNTAGAVFFSGYTGSYIFSATLFALRNQVDHKLSGYVVAAIEFCCFLFPASPVSYIPNFYLGGLLIWLGYGIFMDWMVHSYGRVSRTEYVLIWITFFCVLASELTYGLLAGALISMLVFIFSYARSNIAEVRIIPSKKCIVKTVDQRTILEQFHNNWIAVKLSGYLFFGSSVSIGNNLAKLAIGQRTKLMESLEDCEELVKAAIIESPLILIIDMRQVKGLDATAARTLGALRRSLGAEGISIFITNLHEHQGGIHRLLAAHKAILVNGDDLDWTSNNNSQGMDTVTESPTGVFFTSTDAAVSHCEQLFLDSAVKHGLCRRESESLTFSEVFRSHLHTPNMFVNVLNDYRTMSTVIGNYVKHERYLRGSYLFHMDDPSNEFYIVKRGKISLVTTTSENRQLLEFGPGGVVGETDFYLGRPRSFNAVVVEACEVWMITRDEFDRMVGAAPNMAICLQLLVLHSSSLSSTSVIHLLERAHNSVT